MAECLSITFTVPRYPVKISPHLLIVLDLVVQNNAIGSLWFQPGQRYAISGSSVLLDDRDRRWCCGETKEDGQKDERGLLFAVATGASRFHELPLKFIFFPFQHAPLTLFSTFTIPFKKERGRMRDGIKRNDDYPNIPIVSMELSNAGCKAWANRDHSHPLRRDRSGGCSDGGADHWLTTWSQSCLVMGGGAALAPRRCFAHFSLSLFTAL